jgi:3-oxoacyl-[acyl-carrier-protein] synthase III
MSGYRTRIAGTGSYLPEKILSNHDIEKLVDTSDQWIRERTGIERRHIAAKDQTTTDLGLIAAQKALKDAGLQPQQIDLIIFCTVTGDQVMPSSACVLQEKLGCKSIPAFDLSAACSGFVYGMSVADQFIRSGMYERILVVGAEVIHRFVNYKDRETCILFGDAAGAFVFERAPKGSENIIFSTHLRAEGAHGDLFQLPAGGSKIPFSQKVLDENLQFVKMKGKEIFKNAVRTMSETCTLALETNNFPKEKVDWLIPHQANWRIMEAVADHLDFPKEKVVSIVHEMGNTSAATVPVAFDFARIDGRIKRGQTILFTAFGAGLTAGSALFKF